VIPVDCSVDDHSEGIVVDVVAVVAVWRRAEQPSAPSVNVRGHQSWQPPHLAGDDWIAHEEIQLYGLSRDHIQIGPDSICIINQSNSHWDSVSDSSNGGAVVYVTPLKAKPATPASAQDISLCKFNFCSNLVKVYLVYKLQILLCKAICTCER
jgi:hypothetical protein